MTTEQLDFEYDYFKSNIAGFDAPRGRNPPADAKLNALRTSLCTDLVNTVTTSVNNVNYYHSLTQDFSYLLEEAKTYLNDIKASHPPAGALSGLSTQQQEAEQVTSTDPPVCFTNFVFDTFSAQDIIKDMVFRSIGTRKVAFFGSYEYRYGHIVHPPCPYPSNAAIDTILDTLSEKFDDFNRDTYSCMVTVYPDNRSGIPYHSDDEHNIATDSMIYTLSLGADRYMKFRNKITLDTETFDLKHGSVNVMSKHSQDFWQHSIPPSTLVCGPRVSLTFRKLVPSTTEQNKLPPIHKPRAPPTRHNSPVAAEPKRILLLTDSIHSSFPTHVFPEPLVCIKKLNFKLGDIGRYEHEFKYTDYVVISGGVNDLSRYDYTAQTLISESVALIKSYCVKYPKTVFIFNSILYTRFSWLNKEIDRVNESVFRLSLAQNFQNLWFFDSHHVLTQVHDTVINPTGNGIHITLAARKHVTTALSTCIKLHHTNQPLRSHWPLRSNFRTLTRTYASVI